MVILRRPVGGSSFRGVSIKTMFPGHLVGAAHLKRVGVAGSLGYYRLVGARALIGTRWLLSVLLGG